MGRYDFEIIYKKGSEMPADYLSRNVVNVVSWDSDELAKAQENDPMLKAMKRYLLHRELPSDQKCLQIIRHFADDCFIKKTSSGGE